MNQLLATYRHSLETRQSDAAADESEAKIRKLASDYERIRREMKPGDVRTGRMEQIVASMRRVLPALQSKLGTFAESESPGIRLAAVVILQDFPDSHYLDWLAKRFRIERPFIGYHAALALLSAVRELDMGFYDEIATAIATAKNSLGAKGFKDTDRIRTLELAERELQRRMDQAIPNAGSAKDRTTTQKKKASKPKKK
jgi:hypothetical protein